VKLLQSSESKTAARNASHIFLNVDDVLEYPKSSFFEAKMDAMVLGHSLSWTWKEFSRLLSFSSRTAAAVQL